MAHSSRYIGEQIEPTSVGAAGTYCFQVGAYCA